MKWLILLFIHSGGYIYPVPVDQIKQAWFPTQAQCQREGNRLVRKARTPKSYVTYTCVQP